MAAHSCEAVVVHCIDFRLQEHLNQWLTARFGERNYDRVSVAGGVRDLEFIAGQVQLAHSLHHVRRAILINHEDCGAYGAQGTPGRHAADLQRAAAVLAVSLPGVQVELFLLHLDGTFQPVPLSP
jgi:carbonic anhydrase